jgi:hypothetical protein
VRGIELVIADANVRVQDARVAHRRLHQRAVTGRDGDVVAIVDLVADVVRRRFALAAQIVHPALQLLFQRRQAGGLDRAAARHRFDANDARR